MISNGLWRTLACVFVVACLLPVLSAQEPATEPAPNDQEEPPNTEDETDPPKERRGKRTSDKPANKKRQDATDDERKARRESMKNRREGGDEKGKFTDEERRARREAKEQRGEQREDVDPKAESGDHEPVQEKPTDGRPAGRGQSETADPADQPRTRVRELPEEERRARRQDGTGTEDRQPAKELTPEQREERRQEMEARRARRDADGTGDGDQTRPQRGNTDNAERTGQRPAEGGGQREHKKNRKRASDPANNPAENPPNPDAGGEETVATRLSAKASKDLREEIKRHREALTQIAKQKPEPGGDESKLEELKTRRIAAQQQHEQAIQALRDKYGAETIDALLAADQKRKQQEAGDSDEDKPQGQRGRQSPPKSSGTPKKKRTRNGDSNQSRQVKALDEFEPPESPPATAPSHAVAQAPRATEDDAQVVSPFPSQLEVPTKYGKQEAVKPQRRSPGSSRSRGRRASRSSSSG